MGYTSTIMFATTKSNYLKVRDEIIGERDRSIYILDEASDEEYVKNGKEFVFLELSGYKYSAIYDEVKEVERELSKLEGGYVFCRIGEDQGDAEIRYRTNLPELMEKFDFIEQIGDKFYMELKEEEEFE